MNDWQSPKVQKPPQGTKLLWFKDGDLFIAQRFGHKYVSFQPGQCTILEEPLLWAIAPMPEPYHGIMYLQVDDGATLTIDQAEVQHPEEYKAFVDSLESREWK